MLAYRIRLRPDDNGTFLVTSPDIPGIVSFGESEQDAKVQAVDAIETMLERMMAGGEDLPSPGDAAEGDVLVRLPTLASLKVALHNELRRFDVSRNELARRLRWTRKAVDDLFAFNDPTPLERLEAAFETLGEEITFAVGRAA